MGSQSLSLMLGQALLLLIPLVLSLSVHEWAHAFVAKCLGDTTAERAGRLSLNPLVHIDPLGTVLLPLLLLMGQGSALGQALPFFGWAKPTPVNIGQMTRKYSARTCGMLVSFAGPLANIVLALLASISLYLILRFGGAWPAQQAAATLGVQMLFLNIGLALFNLLPLGTLDGHSVALGLLPHSAAQRFAAFNAQWGMWLLWGVVLFGRGLLSVPIRFVAGLLMGVVDRLL